MAATTRFRYTPYHPLTRKQISSPLHVVGPAWKETVNGSGSLSGAVAVPDDAQARQQVLAALEPDESTILVSTTNGKFPFWGVVTDQDWDPNTGLMSFTAQDWRAWLYDVFIGPKTDMTSDVVYAYANVDQLSLAQQLVQAASAPGAAGGMPPIAFSPQAASKPRDLNFRGTNFKSVGQQLDAISQRDGGFEWWLEAFIAMDGLPMLRLALAYPVRGGVVSGYRLKRTETGGNIIKLNPFKRSSANRVARVWTTGAGQPPDLLFAQDSDPALLLGNTLLREGSQQFSNVINRSTLSSHARSLRQFYSQKVSQLQVQVGMDDPDVTVYTAGDRFPVRYKDRVLDLNLPSVRVVEREVRPDESVVILTLDLNDFSLPDVDEGGAV